LIVAHAHDMQVGIHDWLSIAVARHPAVAATEGSRDRYSPTPTTVSLPCEKETRLGSTWLDLIRTI
jgi:hypothetical protein